MNRTNLVAFGRRAVGSARNLGNKAAAVVAGSLVSASAFAATTPVDEVKAAINAGKTDAIAIAVTVVVALWAIWAIFLMRRKG